MKQSTNRKAHIGYALMIGGLVGIFFAPIAQAFATSTSTCDPTANLVTNGGFETPAVLTTDRWNVFPSPAGGWNVSWVDQTPMAGKPATANLELQQDGYFAAHGGTQFAELDTNWDGPGGPIYSPSPASVIVAQNLSTIPGAKYKIDFFFSARPGYDATQNRLAISWDGSSTATLSLDGTGATQTNWHEYSYTLPAMGTTTAISFADAGVSDSFGTFLDDVSVTCISSPAASSTSGTGSNPTSTATSTNPSGGSSGGGNGGGNGGGTISGTTSSGGGGSFASVNVAQGGGSSGGSGGGNGGDAPANGGFVPPISQNASSSNSTGTGNGVVLGAETQNFVAGGSTTTIGSPDKKSHGVILGEAASTSFSSTTPDFGNNRLASITGIFGRVSNFWIWLIVIILLLIFGYIAFKRKR